jgi:hypothetical protein
VRQALVPSLPARVVPTLREGGVNSDRQLHRVCAGERRRWQGEVEARAVLTFITNSYLVGA